MRWTRMVLVMVVACLAITPAAARAATFTVVTSGDEPDASCTGTECESIRAAVAAAALSAGPDTIVVPGGDFQLLDAQIVLSSDIAIVGRGARDTTIRGNVNFHRAFEVPAGVTASITGVSLVGGRATGTPQNPGFMAGGLVRNSGTLTLDGVRVTGGVASSGGGIANTGGTLTIDRSLIDNNVASIGGSDAGGLLNFGGGELVVRNTTIAFNQATQGAGFLSWGGTAADPNTARFEFVTMARNAAGFTGGVGFDTATGDTLSVRASIIAANTPSNCAQVPQSLGDTVESSDDCQFEVRGAQGAVAEALANLGGPTNALALPVDSPARGLVAAADCLPTDQRGLTRPVGTTCEAGAIEAGAVPPVVTAPAQDGFANGSPLVISGTGVAAGATVLVYSGDPDPIGEAGADALGNWSVELDGIADGLRQFTLIADQGDEESAPTTLRVTVDNIRPVTTIDSRPAAAINRGEASFSFSADEPSTFECSLAGGGRDPQPVACNAGSIAYDGLIDGEYEFAVWAIDRAENRDEDGARYTFVVDSALIAAPTVGEPATEPGAATLTFSTSQADRTFTCRLQGPGRDGAFAPCASPQRYDGLAAGDYVFTVRSSDAAGNFAESTPRAFSVAAPVQAAATPVPTRTPTATPPPTPVPDVGETVVIRPTAGKVLVKRPGSNEFVELKSINEIPLGAEIDTKNGRIQLRFETEDGKVQVGTFYGGIFKVTQIGKVLDLKLTEALAACPKKGKAAAAQTKKKPKKRKLWGDGKGAFRTSGKYSAATVRGTKWLVEDSCAGTLTRVASGVVAVRYLGKDRLVRAGKRFLAKPPR